MNYIDTDDSKEKPPVEIFCIPEYLGSRGYGAKISNGQILIPYNPAVVLHFPEVIVNLQKFSIDRMIFDSLPDYRCEP